MKKKYVKKKWAWPNAFNYAAWLRSYKDIKNLGAYLNLERPLGLRLDMYENRDIEKKLLLMAQDVSENLNKVGMPFPPPKWITPKCVRVVTEKKPKATKPKTTEKPTEETKDA